MWHNHIILNEGTALNKPETFWKYKKSNSAVIQSVWHNRERTGVNKPEKRVCTNDQLSDEVPAVL